MTKKKQQRARSVKTSQKVVNKSAAIRDLLSKDPNGKPQAVARALAEQGVQVSPAFVSQVKLKMKNREGAGSETPTRGRLSQFADSELMEAKRLVDKLGVEKARAAVDLLARLS